MEKVYNIGGIEFKQSKITLGKLRRLLEVFQGIKVPKELSSVGLICAIGNKLHEMFAIVLEGKVKGQENTSIFLDENMTYDQSIEVIEDFLSLNPISGTIEKFAKMLSPKDK